MVDGSDRDDTHALLLTDLIGNLQLPVQYQKAQVKGAASQRNEGMALALHPYILFMDDDILLEPHCLERLWNCLNSNEKTGGANAMVTNQQYQPPGKVTRFMYRLLSGQHLPTYAGKCIGPAWNLLPEDRADLPECNQVEWLNTTCTLYRKAALPTPVFHSIFTGYSLMEDLSLSLQVGKSWLLYNARTARIFHDSQPGSHKNNIREMARMELVNRHYIMTSLLNRTGLVNHAKLVVFQLFGILTSSQRFSSAVWLGKLDGIKAIANNKQ